MVRHNSMLLVVSGLRIGLYLSSFSGNVKSQLLLVLKALTHLSL